jgi:hypothetical protein
MTQLLNMKIQLIQLSVVRIELNLFYEGKNNVKFILRLRTTSRRRMQLDNG